MHLLVRSLVATLLVSASLAAATTSDCRLPRTTSDMPRAKVCGLELVGAIEVSAEGGLGQIAVHDDLGAVVLRDDGQVALIDLTDPTAPGILGTYDGGTGNDSLDHPLDGDVVFSDDGAVLLHARQTSDWSNEGLHVLDVSDPTSPVRTDFHPQGGMIRVTYARIGETEVVATLDATHGLTIHQLVRTASGAKVVPLHVDPLPALKVGGPASAGLHLDPLDVALGVPLLYVTEGETGLHVYDLSTPASPVELGSWGDQGLAAIAVDVREDGTRTIHAAAEYWFDRATVPELVTLDATNLGAISEVGRRNLGDFDGELAWKLGGLHLDGGLLTIAHGHAGLVTLDLASGQLAATATDLGEPNPSTTYRDLAWFAMDTERHGERLLVTDAVTGELRVFERA